eukprot:CAMPEP_0194195698 /NCGR_PEP_ID=MMETSP0154-20130528/76270_1 /TAXON_ID=1049557 /ORGANISM="Thalassiothrix antarctica, Strain L6-D1" /LENGTH=582 /DNA_ID=CAMNT_0038920243 /DNA_START=466 /DNA_END=2214 /DNA_ORIENTATION=-
MILYWQFCYLLLVVIISADGRDDGILSETSNSNQRRGDILNKASSASTMCGMQTPGTLIVDGGKFDHERESNISQAIWRNIPNQRTPKLVLIPSTGKDLKPEEREKYTEQWVDKLGFEESNFYILHPDSNDPDETDVDDAAEANTLEFVAPLLEADAVFIRGGPQRRLLDALKYTSTHQAMWNVLERGGVIAGTSAGASTQGFIMPRFDREWYTYGFGFLPNVAFDTHLDERDRWEDMYELLRNQDDPSSILGIAISEKTAIVVQGDYFQVVGDNNINQSNENDDDDDDDDDDDKGRNDGDDDDNDDGKGGGDDLRGVVAVYTCQGDKESCNKEDSPFLILRPDEWYDLCSRKILLSPPNRNDHIITRKLYSLPYDFRSDFRLAAPRFTCSGRRCQWFSSPIDIILANNDSVNGGFNLGDMLLRLTLVAGSEGDLEQDEDFLQVSYRTSSTSGFNDPIMDTSSAEKTDEASTTFEYINSQWITAHTPKLWGTIRGDTSIIAGIDIDYPTYFRYLQLRLDAETSKERKESYIVQDIKIERIQMPTINASSTKVSMASSVPAFSVPFFAVMTGFLLMCLNLIYQ